MEHLLLGLPGVLQKLKSSQYCKSLFGYFFRKKVQEIYFTRHEMQKAKGGIHKCHKFHKCYCTKTLQFLEKTILI